MHQGCCINIKVSKHLESLIQALLWKMLHDRTSKEPFELRHDITNALTRIDYFPTGRVYCTLDLASTYCERDIKPVIRDFGVPEHHGASR